MTAVFDQVQKLFGKGFLIAAFVPSLLFVGFLKFLRAGWWEMERALPGLWSAGWKVSLTVLAYLIIIYLLAYVLYGIRGLLHNLYQGRWEITLSSAQQLDEARLLPDWVLNDLEPSRPKRWLKPLEFVLNLPFWMGRRSEARSFRTSNEITELRVSALDVPLWVTQTKFADTFHRVKLSPEKALALFEKLDAEHKKFLRRFNADEQWEENEYWEILAVAHLLRANRKRLGRLGQLQRKIDLLMQEMKAEYNANDSLKAAVNRLHEWADREWRTAYSDHKATFPEKERWMRPTRLGNIAMVHEVGPMDRYGINLSAIWPRIWHVLPAETRQRIEDANTYLDFTVIMSFLSFISCGFAIYGAFYGPGGRNTITRGLLILACFASFWAFYQLAIQATRGFGVEAQAAVDAYRLKLLDLLGLERPANAEEEQKIWTELRYFISQGDQPKSGVRVKTPPAQKEEKPAAPNSTKS